MFQEVLSRLTSLGSQIDLMRNESHALKYGASGSFEFRSSSGSNFPQRHKLASIEFQRFHSNDPDTMIFQAERYFDFHSIPEDHRMLLASFYMEGNAAMWF